MSAAPATGRTASARSANITVLGAGVIGLTTAIRLAETGHAVTLLTRDPAHRTTSAVAGALWTPYRIDPADRVLDWSLRTLSALTDLADKPNETGVRLVDGIQALAPGAPLPDWAPHIPGLRRVRPDELPPGRTEGFRARLPLVDMPTHLRHLVARCAALGIPVLEDQHLRTPDDLASSSTPIVVNCTGLGSRELLGDAELTPVQGQLAVVDNPGRTEWYVDADTTAAGAGADPTASTYLFPQPYGLLLGGTARPGEWCRTPDPATAEAILARCAAIDPRLAGARIREHRVGLRPARTAVRLEAEPAPRPDGSHWFHSYGHGGAGVTTAWGCAEEMAALIGPATAA
jgi:D-amino-acid oxidase